MALRSWGQLSAEPALDERWWSDRSARLPSVERSMLAYGNGRSYGDVGLTIMVAGTTPEDERDFGVEGNG